MLVSVISIMIPYLYTFINGHWASPVAQRREVLRSTLFSLLWLNNYAVIAVTTDHVFACISEVEMFPW